MHLHEKRHHVSLLVYPHKQARLLLPDRGDKSLISRGIGDIDARKLLRMKYPSLLYDNYLGVLVSVYKEFTCRHTECRIQVCFPSMDGSEETLKKS